MDQGHYRNFLIMLLVSFFIMYGAMFLNIEQPDHFYLSLSRLYMTLLMIAPMALLMLAVMHRMYMHKMLNAIIIASAVSMFVIALILLRTQTPVQDGQYMKAMISHHSSAILTSKNAELHDPQVRQLAEEIIQAQEREIEQMKQILSRLERK